MIVYIFKVWKDITNRLLWEWLWHTAWNKIDRYVLVLWWTGSQKRSWDRLRFKEFEWDKVTIICNIISTKVSTLLELAEQQQKPFNSCNKLEDTPAACTNWMCGRSRRTNSCLGLPTERCAIYMKWSGREWWDDETKSRLKADPTRSLERPIH